MYHDVLRIVMIMIYIMWAGMFSNVVIILWLTQIYHHRFSDRDVLMWYHLGLGIVEEQSAQPRRQKLGCLEENRGKTKE